MMRNINLMKFILISIFFLSSYSAFAQKNQTNVAFLKENGILLAKKLGDNRQKAYKIARQKKWETFRINKDGSVISLQGVDDFGIPLYYITYNNTIAAATTNTNKLYANGGLGLNLSGSTITNGKVAIWDGGAVLASHVEFPNNKIEVRDGVTTTSTHSTHVAGTMAAAGIYAPAKGMAFGLPKLYSFDFDNDISEMSTNAVNLIISNHSYGSLAGWRYNSSLATPRWEFWGAPGATEDYKFGYYDSDAKAWDEICYNAPYYLPVKSAGNHRNENGPVVGAPYYRFDANGNMVAAGNRPAGISSNNGYGIISTYGTAKNILTVGAVNPLPNGPTGTSSIQIASFSSWGPTDDGRIKPDLVADGINVTSTSDGGNSSYTTLSGTSMAAPNVSGSLVLLQELYNQKNANYMRSASLKALVLGTATDAGLTGPDYIYGWGLLNTEAAAKVILDNGSKSIISERSLVQGGTETINVTASGNGPLIATICWTDPDIAIIPVASALNNNTLRLVNDLDLRATQNTTLFNPWVLDPSNPALPATTGDNFRDNVEQIYIADAVPGRTYTFTISHKGTLQRGPQAYSVVIMGAGGNTYCASTPNSNADSKINNFNFANINYTATNNCSTYNDFTTQTIELEKGSTYPLTLTLGTCGGNFDKIAKVFIDWNSDGDFDDANETAAISGVVNSTGVFTTNISVPNNVIPNNSSLLRVVLNETNNAANVLACGNYVKGETQDYKVKFLNASFDVGIKSIINPSTGICANAKQTVSVVIKNFGTQNINNFPVTATILENTTVIATLTGTFNGTITPLAEQEYTLPGFFNAQSGKTYTIKVNTALIGDLNPANNEISENIQTLTAPIIDVGSVATYFCNSTNSYALTSANAGTMYWYKNLGDQIPIAVGNFTNTIEMPNTNNSYFAGLNDYTSSLGPKTKNEAILGGGTYLQTTGAITVTTLTPIILESARLYIGNSGIIKFSVTNSAGMEVSSATLNVVATRSNPGPGTLPNDLTDQGQEYPLNLSFPSAGTYTISISYDSPNGATIFRNNGGASGISYPFNSALNIFSITGNNASPASSFYYYFYDAKVRALGCLGNARIQVPITGVSISKTNATLSSSIADNNQWYFNGVKIDGATSKDYTPTQNGKYFVEITLSTGCTLRSQEITFSDLAETDNEIGFKAYPVPTNSDVNIVFNVIDKEDVSLKISNILGQIIYQDNRTGFIGSYSNKVDLAKSPSGIYGIKIQIGNKTYSKKIIRSE